MYSLLYASGNITYYYSDIYTDAFWQIGSAYSVYIAWYCYAVAAGVSKSVHKHNWKHDPYNIMANPEKETKNKG